MKIAIIAPVEEAIPPQKYGGTEWVVYAIAHSLGKRGHDVDLYASADSRQEGNYTLIPITPHYLRSQDEYNKDEKLRESAKFLSLAKTLSLLKDKHYDIINNHASWRLALFADMLEPKPITVHHMPLSLAYQQLVFKQHPELQHISLSNNQRKDLPELDYLATIYNGVDLASYPTTAVNDDQQDNLIFLGRMSENKGAVDAAQIADALHKPLTVVAKVDIADQAYYAKFKKYSSSTNINFLGELAHADGVKLLAKSKALLMPIAYEDPCPLVPLETMACGTPVIAYAMGALPEQVVDGETGFLVNRSVDDIRGDWIIKKTGVEGLKEAVERIYALNDTEYTQMRKKSREHIEKKFTVERMVDEYEKVFLEVAKK